MYLPKQITLSWSTGSKFKACIHYISCYVSRKMARGSRLIWIGRPITLQLFKLYMQSMVIFYTLKNKGASRCHRLGYKKFGNILELSYSTVAIQRFSKTGFTRNRHCKGRSKKLSPCALRQVQNLASKNRRMSAASIALEVAEAEGQLASAQTIRHTLQQVGLHGCHPRRKPLLKLAHKKPCKQFAEDNLARSMNYWNHVLWSDELKVNLFDSDGVQHVWRCPGEEFQENCALPTVKHGGGSIMVWGCMITRGRPIIGADIKHFYDYRPFPKQICW